MDEGMERGEMGGTAELMRLAERSDACTVHLRSDLLLQHNTTHERTAPSENGSPPSRSHKHCTHTPPTPRSQTGNTLSSHRGATNSYVALAPGIPAVPLAASQNLLQMDISWPEPRRTELATLPIQSNASRRETKKASQSVSIIIPCASTARCGPLRVLRCTPSPR
jgi:hypothetical protein